VKDIEKELSVLGIYLKTCLKKDFFLEAIWLAFEYKEKNPKWDTLKCFEASIWDWLLYSDLIDKKSSPAEFLKKMEELKKKEPKNAK
jgi:hypothetical protein